MEQNLNYIFEKIDALNPIHGKKLKKNAKTYDQSYYQYANNFFQKYMKFLKNRNKTLDYAIDCYLKMVSDFNRETIDFFRTGKYSYSTFSEVNDRVYANPETMEYYVHGIIMSQFLWKHHYQIFEYFSAELPNYKNQIQHYLEIGAGHGLYLNQALQILNPDTTFTVVDVSKTSIDIATNFTSDSRVQFNHRDIQEFDTSKKFDFITMGEVLEHVEDPVKLLKKIYALLNEGGTAFITVPANAPAIDHIYLFNNVAEIRDMAKSVGFKVIDEKSFPAEDLPQDLLEKYKVTIMYAVFLRRDT